MAPGPKFDICVLEGHIDITDVLLFQLNPYFLHLDLNTVCVFVCLSTEEDAECVRTGLFITVIH